MGNWVDDNGKLFEASIANFVLKGSCENDSTMYIR